MKQLFIKKGHAIIKDVPAPALNEREVLVRVHYSCISIGTETFKVSQSAKPLYKKILEQPQYIDKFKKQLFDQGFSTAIKKAKAKVQTENPIGYSVAGEVIKKGNKIIKFNIGDLVACAGDRVANHAEFIAAPENLTVAVPEGLSLDKASTVAMGSIALQGVRRCEPKIGDFVLVVGLGFLGQLTTQILRLSGCRVIGTDINPARLNIASDLGLLSTINPGLTDAREQLLRITDGYGADSVIITASSGDENLINQVISMTRKKGRIVVVGGVVLNINRDIFYEKELDLLISTSYGPGRYEDKYELKGIDYPYYYVRWTENRNMKEYLKLLSEGRISLDGLVEEVYKIDEVPQIYEKLKSDVKKPISVLIKYEKTAKSIQKVLNISFNLKNDLINTGIIGIGGFARDVHIPNLDKLKDMYSILAFCDKDGGTAAFYGSQYNAKYSTTDYREIINDRDIDLVFITTRHNLHATIAKEALQAGKAVFVEKPMAINKSELDGLVKVLQKTKKPYLVGFNRRFSHYIKRIKDILNNRINPIIINYIMNAGFIPAGSWIHGDEGGGRNIGEACHVYDIFNFLTGSKVSGITAFSINPKTEQFLKNDNFVATIKYADGSVCNLIYTSLGSEEVSKEQMEIYCDNKIMFLDDYRELCFYGEKLKSVKNKIQDKGHYAELVDFGNSIKSGKTAIPLQQLVQATEISFEVEQQIAGDKRCHSG